MVLSRDVVGIFDMDVTTVSEASRRFLADAQKGGRVVNVGMQLPKSYVVCRQADGTETVYISPLSAATIRRRNEEKGKGNQHG